MEEEKVGILSKNWTNEQEDFIRQKYSIKFPLNCDVYTKALLIGACFLIVSLVS